MKRKGFTLIEVLVVIAIITILAAILFPVFNNAKRNAKMKADSTNMATLHQALKLYKEDQGGYPPQLFQVAEYAGNTLRPVNDVRRAYLYRTRVKDADTFTGVIAAEKKDQLTQACWPTQFIAVTGNPNPDTDQAFGPNTLVTYQHLGIDPTFLNGDMVTDPARFYSYDTYDTAPSFNPACAPRRELRYVLFWTGTGQLGGAPTDSTRQLGYHDPKESTVITWNTYFQQTAGNPKLPTNAASTMVLFLNGTVRFASGRDVYSQSWGYGRNF